MRKRSLRGSRSSVVKIIDSTFGNRNHLQAWLQLSFANVPLVTAHDRSLRGHDGQKHNGEDLQFCFVNKPSDLAKDQRVAVPIRLLEHLFRG